MVNVKYVMNYNNNQSFVYKTRKKVLNMLIELNEINNLPPNQITHHALDRKNYLETRLKYCLVPINQKLEIDNFFNKKYLNYLVLNPEVVYYLIDKAGGSEEVENKIKRLS